MGWRSQLGDEVEARISDIQVMGAPITVYRGGPPTKAPTISANDPRVRPYLVLWTSGGRPTGEEDLGVTVRDLIWQCSIVAVGPDGSSTDKLSDLVDDRIQNWTPELGSVSVNPFRSSWTGQPMDPSPSPTSDRFFIPMPYWTTVGI